MYLISLVIVFLLLAKSMYHHNIKARLDGRSNFNNNPDQAAVLQQENRWDSNKQGNCCASRNTRLGSHTLEVQGVVLLTVNFGL